MIYLLTDQLQKTCFARHFALLRNTPLSSIHIHFGVVLLVLVAPLTSASLSKNKFFDRLNHPCCYGSRGDLICD